MCRHASWLLIIGLACSTNVHAEVRRCLTDDGVTIYTDRTCEHFKAQDIAKPAPEISDVLDNQASIYSEPALNTYGSAYTDCPRQADSFLFNLRRTLESRDINALAALYHWAGHGSKSATYLMDRLESILETTDGSAELIYPEAAFVAFNPDAFPGIPPEDPIGVRFTQFVPQSDYRETQDGSTMKLIKHAGCWWLQF